MQYNSARNTSLLGWRKFTNKDPAFEDLKKLAKIPSDFGIFPFLCRAPGGNGTTNGHSQSLFQIDAKDLDFCKQFWEVYAIN